MVSFYAHPDPERVGIIVPRLEGWCIPHEHVNTTERQPDRHLDLYSPKLPTTLRDRGKTRELVRLAVSRSLRRTVEGGSGDSVLLDLNPRGAQE